MKRVLSIACLVAVTGCGFFQRDDNPVKGGDELSAFVGLPVATAVEGFTQQGYTRVGEEDGSEYWSNRRSRACARTRVASGRLITVVQLPRAACQTVSR